MSVIGSPVALELRRVGSTFPAAVQAPKAARQWAARVLAKWNSSVDPDVALLLLSEIVTNAVLHGVDAGADRASGVRVELIDTVSGLHVKVHDPDHGEGGEVAVRPAADESESGRGLELVEALSSAWWCERTSDGKCVHVILDSVRPTRGWPGVTP